jgi:hypothetical protein
MPYSEISFRRIKADDRKLHVDAQYSHAWWKSVMERAFDLA